MLRLTALVGCLLTSVSLGMAPRAAGPAVEQCTPVVSEVRSGRCIRVADGDTLTVLIGEENISVRLEGIDAPESRQDHGAKAKAALSDLVKGQSIEVHVTGQDRYQRTLAIVIVGDVNVNERLVEDGWAWQYDEYNCDPHLAELEETARSESRGLWAHEHAVAPWEFRRLERERRELVRQRQQVGVSEPAATGTPATEPAPAVESSDDIAPGFWLNSSSNVRHNTTCPHFKNTKKGRSCSKDEGTACGICGG